MTKYRFDQIAENIRVPIMPKPEDSERYIGLEHMDTDSLQIRRWGAPTALIGQKLAMKKGDVLFAKRNAYIRRVAVAPFDGLFSAHGMVLRAKTDVCLHEFLPVFMSSDYFMERAIKISVGSLSPTINWSSLNREEFEIPSLDEQRRIADLLWAADDEIDSFRQLFAEACKLEASLKVSIFAGNHHKIKLGSLVDEGRLSFKTGPFGTVLKASSYVKKGVPVVNPVNMSDGKFYVDDGPFISEQEAKRLEIYKIFENDLIFGRKGDIGRGIFATKESEGYLFGSDCICVRVIGESIMPKYLFYFLTSPNSKRLLGAQSHGTTMPGINEKMLSRMEISIPDDSEQLEIVKKLEQVTKRNHKFKKEFLKALI